MWWWVCPGVATTRIRMPCGLDHVAVGDAEVRVTHLLRRRQDVGRPQLLRQLEPAGHVVVVDVGLEDVAEAYSRRVQQHPDPVGVALRIHDQGHLAVVGEIAPVAQPRRLDDLDRHRSCGGLLHRAHGPCDAGLLQRAALTPPLQDSAGEGAGVVAVAAQPCADAVRAATGPADHQDGSGGVEFAEPVGDLVHGDVPGSRDAAGVPLVEFADVEELEVAAGGDLVRGHRAAAFRSRRGCSSHRAWASMAYPMRPMMRIRAVMSL